MKLYNLTVAPLGSVITGFAAREIAESIEISMVLFNGKDYTTKEDISEIISSVEDWESFAVLVNGNSSEVNFTQLFTADRVQIYTGMTCYENAVS